MVSVDPSGQRENLETRVMLERRETLDLEDHLGLRVCRERGADEGCLEGRETMVTLEVREDLESLVNRGIPVREVFLERLERLSP